jgi:hypothetical protein
MSTIHGTQGSNGLVAAEYIRELVLELSHDLATEERKSSRDAREDELEKGLAAADELRNKASSEAWGAAISGTLTIASGAGELAGASALDHALASDPTKTIDAQMLAAKPIEARIQAAGSVVPLGGAANGLFAARADRDAAGAQSLEAESKAAGHKADEAETNRQSILKTEDSVKSLEQDISRTIHSGMMAILARQ